jgi:hypothetical protein
MVTGSARVVKAPRIGCAMAAFLTLATLTGDAQTVRYIDGVFVAPRGGGSPIELIAYAEMLSTGILRMQQGTLDDAPFINELVSVLASMPTWRPHSVTISSEQLFRDERAERRSLAISGGRLNVYAIGLRVADLERREKIESLLKSVKASATNPGYAFVSMQSDGYIRYYPIRLTPLEKCHFEGAEGTEGVEEGVEGKGRRRSLRDEAITSSRRGTRRSYGDGK